VHQIGQRTPRRRFRFLRRIPNWQDHLEQVHDANYTLGEAATGVRRAGTLQPARWPIHAGTEPAPVNAHQRTQAGKAYSPRPSFTISATDRQAAFGVIDQWRVAGQPLECHFSALWWA
jgi:hypothetical protein